MKTKKFNKKLSLGKRTVSDLNTNEMLNVNGGGETMTQVCFSCVVTCMTLCEICTDLCQEPTDPAICL